MKVWKEKHAEHAQKRGTELLDNHFVMCRLDGDLIDPNSLTHNVNDGIKILNLPHVSFHDLRHTHATILLQANVPLKIVSERLGHASITMTANTYAHVTETMQKEATEKFSEIMRKTSSNSNKA